MSGHDTGASVRVSKEMVTAAGSNHLETEFPEGRKELLAREARQPGHRAIVSL